MKISDILAGKDPSIADTGAILVKVLLIIGWHFVMLPIGLLWSLTLIGLYDGGLTWTTFAGAIALLAILRSAIK